MSLLFPTLFFCGILRKSSLSSSRDCPRCRILMSPLSVRPYVYPSFVVYGVSCRFEEMAKLKTDIPKYGLWLPFFSIFASLVLEQIAEVGYSQFRGYKVKHVLLMYQPNLISAKSIY